MINLISKLGIIETLIYNYHKFYITKLHRFVLHPLWICHITTNCTQYIDFKHTKERFVTKKKKL